MSERKNKRKKKQTKMPRDPDFHKIFHRKAGKHEDSRKKRKGKYPERFEKEDDVDVP